MKNLETKISHNNTAVKVDGGQIKVSFWPCDATEVSCKLAILSAPNYPCSLRVGRVSLELC